MRARKGRAVAEERRRSQALEEAARAARAEAAARGEVLRSLLVAMGLRRRGYDPRAPAQAAAACKTH